VLDSSTTLRLYGELYKHRCNTLGRWIFDGLNPGGPKLDAAALAERIDRCDDVMERLVLEAVTAYSEYWTDGATCASVCLAHDLWRRLRSAEDYTPLTVLCEALIAGARADPAQDAPTIVAQKVLVPAPFVLGEDAFDGLVDRLEEVVEDLQAQALALPTVEYEAYFDGLYRTAMRTFELMQLVQRLQAIHQIKADEGIDQGVWSQRFARRVERSRRLADERLVRISESLRGDPEDILGGRPNAARDAVQAIRARDGEPAARLAALQRTIHTFDFPRCLEPYLLGETEAVSWKQVLVAA
jgi:hypothetical protein